MKYMTYKQLREYGIPYSRQHLSRLEAADQFPKRIRLGQCRVVWKTSDVEHWLQEREALSS